MSTIHNPVNFNPQDYRVVGYFDNHPPMYYFGMAESAYQAMLRDWELGLTQVYGPDFRSKIHSCVHCGNGTVRYISACEHIPSGEIVTFGSSCVHRLDLPNADAFKAKYIRDQAAIERKKKEIAEAMEKVLNDNPDFKAAVACFDEHADTVHMRNSFARDILHKFRKYGNLSDRQRDCFTESISRDHEYQARKEAEANEPKGPAPTGRQEVTGTVLSIKEQDTPFGFTLKMLVKLENNSKVWCTVPSAALDELDRRDEITFKATFTPSDDDPHFAFGSRPTLISINGER